TSSQSRVRGLKRRCGSCFQSSMKLSSSGARHRFGTQDQWANSDHPLLFSGFPPSVYTEPKLDMLKFRLEFRTVSYAAGIRMRFFKKLTVNGYLCLLAGIFSAHAATTISTAPGLTVSVESNGVYTVNVQSPSWHFSGNLGYPVYNISAASGYDALGGYREISFDFQTDAPRHAAIRSYFDS